MDRNIHPQANCRAAGRDDGPNCRDLADRIARLRDEQRSRVCAMKRWESGRAGYESLTLQTGPCRSISADRDRARSKSPGQVKCSEKEVSAMEDFGIHEAAPEHAGVSSLTLTPPRCWFAARRCQLIEAALPAPSARSGSVSGGRPHIRSKPEGRAAELVTTRHLGIDCGCGLKCRIIDPSGHFLGRRCEQRYNSKRCNKEAKREPGRELPTRRHLQTKPPFSGDAKGHMACIEEGRAGPTAKTG